MSLINQIKKIIKRSLVKKVPVNVPILEGSLLKGKTAIVTGGSSGIGYAIAENFLKNGAKVIITGRSKEKLDVAVNNLKNSFPNQYIDYYVCDNCDVEQIRNCVCFFENNMRIDILVNNAGVLTRKNFNSMSEEEYEKVLNTNLKGYYFWSQAISNYFIKYKIAGNILNVGSSSCLRPAISPYSISKWGVLGLTEGLAKSLIPYGIVVNGIAPGQTLTSMAVYDSKRGINNDNVPCKRWIMPEEVANMATVLVSPIGRMIVGDMVYLTGGAGNLTVDDIEYYNKDVVEEFFYNITD